MKGFSIFKGGGIAFEDQLIGSKLLRGRASYLLEHLERLFFSDDNIYLQSLILPIFKDFHS